MLDERILKTGESETATCAAGETRPQCRKVLEVGTYGTYATLADAVRSLACGTLVVVSPLVETEPIVIGRGQDINIIAGGPSVEVYLAAGQILVDGGALSLGNQDEDEGEGLGLFDARVGSRGDALVCARGGATLTLHRGVTIAPADESMGGFVAVKVGEGSRFRGFGGRATDATVVLDEGCEGFIKAGLYQTRYASALVVRGHLSEISGGSFRCAGGTPGVSRNGLPEPGPGVCVDGGAIGRVSGCGMFSDASHGLLVRNGGRISEIAGGKFQSFRPEMPGCDSGPVAWCGALVDTSSGKRSAIETISAGAFVGAPGLCNAGEVGSIGGGTFVGSGTGPGSCGLLNGCGPEHASDTVEIGEISGGRFVGALAGIANSTFRGRSDGAVHPARIGVIRGVEATGASATSDGYGILNEGGKIGEIGTRVTARGGHHGLYNSPSGGVGGMIGKVHDAVFGLTPESQSNMPGIYNAVEPGEDAPAFGIIGSLERVRCNFGVTAWYGMVNAGKIGAVSDSLFVGYAAGVVNRPGGLVGVLKSGTYWGYGEEGRYGEAWGQYNRVFGYLNQSTRPTEVEPATSGPFGGGRYRGATGPFGGIDADADGVPDNIVFPAGYELVTRPCRLLPSRHVGTPELGFCFFQRLFGLF